jgi:hypothetical protein
MNKQRLPQVKKHILSYVSYLSLFMRKYISFKHPSAEHFKAQFAATVKSRIMQGKSSASLGKNLNAGTYEEPGHGFFESLMVYGLKQEDTCVDYGCGTYALGCTQLDIWDVALIGDWTLTDFFWTKDANSLAKRSNSEKRPNLRVISPESLAEVAVCKPAMLFSAKVLSHVHPAELSEYFGNILTIIGLSGQAIIRSRWSDDETIRCDAWSWAHSITTIRDLVHSSGGDMIVLKEKDRGGFNKAQKSGVLRIVAQGTVAPGGRPPSTVKLRHSGFGS